jgi:hypothetical protein
LTTGFAALTVDDELWTTTTDAARTDIFYRSEYCRFRSQGSPHRSLMLRYEDDLGVAFDVAIEKRVDTLAFFEDLSLDIPFAPLDFASPEYNGPVLVAAPRDRYELLRRFRGALEAYYRDRRVVTEFVRVHPFSSTESPLSELEQLHDVSEVVYVDLRGGHAAASRGYRKGHRAAVKKAERLGASVEIVAPDAGHVARLSELYLATMVRAGAKSVYRHPLQHFSALFEQLGDRALLVEARVGDELAASAVFLLGDRHVWYLYAGTNEALLPTGANNFKIDRMIAWAAERGFEALVLGGGFATGDGLFHTKRGYSHLTAPVRHLRKVHDPSLLDRLLRGKAAHDARLDRTTRTDYFPSYWLA